MDEWVSAWIRMFRLIIGLVIKDESEFDDLRGDREKANDDKVNE